MALSVVARLWTSSWDSGTGRRRERAVPVISSAPRRSAAMGRRVPPMITQLAPASSISSSGVPTISTWPAVLMLVCTSLKGRAAITVCPRSALSTRTRSTWGIP